VSRPALRPVVGAAVGAARALAFAFPLGLTIVLVAASAVLAASPTASPIGGDPRSAGEGPGLVGEPLLAIGGVLVIALVAVATTLAWVRLTGSRGRNTDPRSR
jgi:hypothetical protein